MDSWFIYLFRVSLVFTVLFVFYLIMLRNNSFFTLQRAYLLSSLFFAFALPLIHIAVFNPSRSNNPIRTLGWIFPTTTYKNVSIITESVSGFHTSLALIYFIPLLVLGAFFCTRLIYLFSISADYSDMLSGRTRIIVSSSNLTPFSFLNRIYLNPVNIQQPSIRYILLHETGHIHQKHSLDIILVELVCIILWFHPLIWLYRKSIREVHEYLADKYVLNTGVDKLAYQEIIVRYAMHARESILLANGFSGNMFKRRIKMITQKGSASIYGFRFLIIVPLITVFLFLFSDIQARNPNTNFSLPIHEGHISSRYGDRIHPFTGKKAFHRGIDISAKQAVSVYASAPGVVIETGYHEKSGNYIIIAHTDSFATFYSQLSEILVVSDDQVTTETIIGSVGSSGVSTGPHLHFELTCRRNIYRSGREN